MYGYLRRQSSLKPGSGTSVCSATSFCLPERIILSKMVRVWSSFEAESPRRFFMKGTSSTCGAMHSLVDGSRKQGTHGTIGSVSEAKASGQAKGRSFIVGKIQERRQCKHLGKRSIMWIWMPNPLVRLVRDDRARERGLQRCERNLWWKPCEALYPIHRNGI